MLMHPEEKNRSAEKACLVTADGVGKIFWNVSSNIFGIVGSNSKRL